MSRGEGPSDAERPAGSAGQQLQNAVADGADAPASEHEDQRNHMDLLLQAIADRGMAVYRKYSEPGPVAADWSDLLLRSLKAYVNNATLSRRDEVRQQHHMGACSLHHMLTPHA